MKVTIIDAVSAWVMEQQVYDAQGRLRAARWPRNIAAIRARGCMFPRPCGWSVPRRVSRCAFDLGAVQVNQLQGNPAELWTMPSYPGSPLVDLGNPNLLYGPPPGMSAGR